MIEDLEWILEKALSFKAKPNHVLKELRELASQCEQDSKHRGDREKLPKRIQPLKEDAVSKQQTFYQEFEKRQKEGKGGKKSFFQESQRPEVWWANLLVAQIVAWKKVKTPGERSQSRQKRAPCR